MGYFQVLKIAMWFRLKELSVVILKECVFFPLLRRLLASTISNFRLTTHRWRSRTRQLCLRRDMRCFVPVGVDGSIVCVCVSILRRGSGIDCDISSSADTTLVSTSKSARIGCGYPHGIRICTILAKLTTFRLSCDA